MTRPIVALLTDFGLRDWYVGAMKGAIKSICPEADLLDITHEVPERSVIQGALMLASARDAFPADTVFVAVIDPGVGSTREPVIVHAWNQWFVGPNNGLFSLVADENAECRVISETAYFRTTVSPTFHGRDIFAPVAAHLACGVEPTKIAPAVTELVRLSLPQVIAGPGRVIGNILHFDRFGNAITNIRETHFEAMRSCPDLRVIAGGFVSGILNTYSDVAPMHPVAYIGSSGFLELAINRGNARSQCGLDLMQPVAISSWSADEDGA